MSSYWDMWTHFKSNLSNLQPTYLPVFFKCESLVLKCWGLGWAGQQLGNPDKASLACRFLRKLNLWDHFFPLPQLQRVFKCCIFSQVPLASQQESEQLYSGNTLFQGCPDLSNHFKGIWMWFHACMCASSTNIFLSSLFHEWPTKEDRQKSCTFCIFQVHGNKCLKWPQMAPGFFPY